MDIKIGADVMGTDEKLGEVQRVIVDGNSNTVTDLVVKHGFLFARERIVPRSHITDVTDGVIHVDLDKHGFEAMDGFTDERYHTPDPNYTGPPGFANSEFLLDAAVAGGSGAGIGAVYSAPPLGFPGGEAVTPDDPQRAAIHVGSDVLDDAGEKVGEVGELTLTPDTGYPTHLVVRRGFLFTEETEIPLGWIQEFSDKGVTLNVHKDSVEHLAETVHHGAR
jgi:uncharacterized protein YrrD